MGIGFRVSANLFFLALSLRGRFDDMASLKNLKINIFEQQHLF
jgi:hypothetical protein